MKSLTEEQLQEFEAVKALLNETIGAEQIVMRGTKLDVLNLLASDDYEEQLTAYEKIIRYDPTFTNEEICWEQRIQNIINAIAFEVAHKNLADELERCVNEKMQERQDDYYREIKAQILKEKSGPENSATMKKLEELIEWEKVSLSRGSAELLRPADFDEIIGQDKAVRALIAKIASPFPQHIIMYGPPGVGKTSAARLGLEAAKRVKMSVFSKDAPFVEVDGTTLRWDPRDTTNPLIGSVHDPIYQGARRDFADSGIPEPKAGLVTKANGGILFIDEIGEMDPVQLNKLLKVLEDKRVFFESSYYDPDDPGVPQYIRDIFDKGLPGDFILIGATTRDPSELSPALRSRCGEVYFSPLSPDDIKTIVCNAAKKLGVRLGRGAAELIAEYTIDGRKAVGVLTDVYGKCLYERGANGKSVIIRKQDVEAVIQNSRLSPLNKKIASDKTEIGRIFGLGVAGFLGSALEIEAVAFHAAEKGKGRVHFNDTAGSMAKDSVFNASSVYRLLGANDFNDYDIHVNVVGGGNIDGPSAGCAIFTAIYSALKALPIPQNIAMTGEISIRGQVRPVGGIVEKLYGAREAGMKKMILPKENLCDVPKGVKGIEIIPVETVEEIIDAVFSHF